MILTTFFVNDILEFLDMESVFSEYCRSQQGKVFGC